MFLNTCIGKRHRGLLTILLILCGDIELIPSPVNVSFLFEFFGEHGLKIVHQNIHGLLDKFNLLEALVNKHNCKINYILSETHIMDSDKNDENDLYELPGYRFNKRNQQNGNGGGVAIYVKNGITFKQWLELENHIIESIWLEIFVKKSISILIDVFTNLPRDLITYHRISTTFLTII